MSKKFAKQYQRLGLPESTAELLPQQKAEMIYGAACLVLKIEPNHMPDVSMVREKYRPSQLALHKLQVVRDAITGDQEADWNDMDEYKYGGWFWMDDPCFRFCAVNCTRTDARAGLGSRLCTFSDSDQEFFMKECVALWADFHGGKLPS
jgi:hypothetical protein